MAGSADVWVADVSPGVPGSLLAVEPGRPVELVGGAGLGLTRVGLGLLAAALTRRPLVAVDLNPVACDFARRNAADEGLGDLVEVREGALDQVLADDERFAVVIADPPWVRRTETGRFPEDPLLAIDGGDDGLEVAWGCVAVASRHLLPGGAAVLQLGTRAQADTIGAGLADLGSLTLGEVRECERGVLVRLDQP